MVKIRLMRVGKSKQGSYRVVVADSRSPRDGKIIESIGHYGPRADPSVVEIDNERAVFWLQRGAQPSDQARKLLTISGAWGDFKGVPSEGAPAGSSSSRTGARATPAASVAEEAPVFDAGEDEAEGARG